MTEELERLRAARRVGYVFSGGSARCAFQVGALATLRELSAAPALCVGVSGGAWNAAAVAAGTAHRLRTYWRAYTRMPHLDFRNLLTEDRSPYLFAALHRRTFERYVGTARLRAPGALPLYSGVTRLRDWTAAMLEVARFPDPLLPLLASNYLPPFYTLPPRLDGERYADGALSDNVPYGFALERGCDLVVLFHNRGESEGGLFKNPREADFEIPAADRGRVLVVRPRHRLPVAFTERRWRELERIVEIGRLRAREIFLGERHPETDARAEGRPPSYYVYRALRRLGQRMAPEREAG